MRKLYNVSIVKDVDVLKDGIMSFGKTPHNFEHKIDIQLWEESISDVYNKIAMDYNGYNIMYVNKLK